MPSTPSYLLNVVYRSIDELQQCPHNARTHSKRQLRQIAGSMKAFGWTNPILVDATGMIVAGHGRWKAAKLLEFTEVPTICLGTLTQAEIRAYLIADNQLALKAGWDEAVLAIELEYLLSLDLPFELDDLGLEVAEVDLILANNDPPPDKADVLETDPQAPAITKLGDTWLMGDHRVVCGDSRDHNVIASLMNGLLADVVVTDPPYNVRIDGHASGNGNIHHEEFAMASGEMTPSQFADFLRAILAALIRFSKDGSVHFLFMDWRHMLQLQIIAEQLYDALLNLCVWVKNNGGMGSFYRSQHELVAVYRNGKKAHRNNIQLGKFGRDRTNIWTYPGASTFSKQSDEGNLLALHPTVKPVTLIADALLDCSARGETVLDTFLASGTTLIAAERTGRRCYGAEIDPLYVDIAVRRWQRYTGRHAVHSVTGEVFDGRTSLEVSHGR